MGDEAFRRIDSQNSLRHRAVEDDAAERPRAAADIEPAPARRDRKPVDEVARHRRAPAPDIALIGLAARPDIFAHAISRCLRRGLRACAHAHASFSYRNWRQRA
jgi:hypothetical protein